MSRRSEVGGQRSEAKGSRFEFFKLYGMILKNAVLARPFYWVMKNLAGVVHGFLQAYAAVATAHFFQSVEDNLTSGGSTQTVVLMLLALTVVVALTRVFNGLHNYMWGVLYDYGRRRAGIQFMEKTAKLEPILYEDTQTLDELVKAKDGMTNSVWLAESVFDFLVFYITFMVTIGTYLATLSPLLIVILALAALPGIFTQILRGKVNKKAEDTLAPIRRHYWYYEACTCSREMFKESRILGLFSHFKREYRKATEKINAVRWQVCKKVDGFEMLMSLIRAALFLAAFGLLLNSLLRGEISVAVFSALFAALGLLFGIFSEVINRIGNQVSNYPLVKNYYDFMQRDERHRTTAAQLFDVKLDGVVFRYPSAEVNAINGIDLTIADGETVAIVGDNGAGKSTLVKLILGLLLPSEGSIQVGGVDSAKLLPDRLSAVFQKYQRYQMTLGDNITISDEPHGASVLDACLAEADLSLAEFAEGYDTMLSREFDGTDLSGGQWQRVALARGLYRVHGLIVLDEPTAAIDPLEETRIYKRFAALSAGKTALVITHRLGSARIAKRILVMRDGLIVETGDHDSLMAQGGLYADMFNAQRQWYDAPVTAGDL